MGKPRRHSGAKTFNPSINSQPLAISQALLPHDLAVREADRKWGVDRLPSLVSHEMNQRWARAVAALNAALDEDNVEHVAYYAEGCARGIAVMEAEAESRGHKPIAAHVAQVEIEGMRFGILLNDEAWPIASETFPGVQMFSLREVAVALRHLRLDSPVVRAAKDQFAGAEVLEIRAKVDCVQAAGDLNDPIPF